MAEDERRFWEEPSDIRIVDFLDKNGHRYTGYYSQSLRVSGEYSYKGIRHRDGMLVEDFDEDQIVFIRDIVEAAGITGRIVMRDGKGRSTNSKTFHGLRHSFISRLARRVSMSLGSSGIPKCPLRAELHLDEVSRGVPRSTHSETSS